MLDVTLGLAGHAAALAERLGPTGSLTGIDADAGNLADAKKRLSKLPCTFVFHHGNFGDVIPTLQGEYDIILADLGLSSPHVDDATRGFSFRADAPLDMRYDRTAGETAAQLITRLSTEELTAVLNDYGEIHGILRLAQKVKGDAPQTTHALAKSVESIFGFRTKSVLPQIFQALRIAVNNELGALNVLLENLSRILAKNGRCAILSYHSLEDRLVKQTFRALVTVPKDPITGQPLREPRFTLLTKHAVVPSEREVAENPRSRSAKLRAIRKA